MSESKEKKKIPIEGKSEKVGEITVPLEKKEGMVLFMHEQLATGSFEVAKGKELQFVLHQWFPASGVVIEINDGSKELAAYRVTYREIIAAILETFTETYNKTKGVKP